MAAAKFKAKCLATLDEVQRKRESVIVTKNGKPVAKLVPLDIENDLLAVFRFPGKITFNADIMLPIHSDDELEAFSSHTIQQLR